MLLVADIDPQINLFGLARAGPQDPRRRFIDAQIKACQDLTMDQIHQRPEPRGRPQQGATEHTAAEPHP